MPVILDGLNDQGLSVGLFYFPGYASYTPMTADNAKRALAPYEFGLWALANFATVDEVREAVKDIVLVPTPAPGLGSPQGMVPGVHFFLQDRSGKSIAVEPVDGTLKVHDAPLGVMTNAPTYDWHMTNLTNYINLSPKDVSQETLGSTTLSAFGSGTGMLGLPGDFTPPSRFVRAVMFSQAATPNKTVVGLPHLEPVRHPQGLGGERRRRRADARDHRMDQRERSQESALVFPHLHRSIDSRGRSQRGCRRRQGRALDHRDGRNEAADRQCLSERHEQQQSGELGAAHRRRLDEFHGR
jgi:hypothetical protein